MLRRKWSEGFLHRAALNLMAGNSAIDQRIRRMGALLFPSITFCPIYKDRHSRPPEDDMPIQSVILDVNHTTVAG